MSRRARLAPAAATLALVVGAACGSSGTRTPATPAARRCPAAPVVARTQADVDALRGCTTLAGLTLQGAAALDLTPLATLARVDGELRTGTTFVLGSVRLPALAHVGGALRFTSNLDLTGIYLPRLVHAGSVTVTDAPALLELMLPALRSLPGDLALARLPSLELVDLGALAAPGGRVSVDGVPRLATWFGATSPLSEP